MFWGIFVCIFCCNFVLFHCTLCAHIIRSKWWVKEDHLLKQYFKNRTLVKVSYVHCSTSELPATTVRLATSSVRTGSLSSVSRSARDLSPAILKGQCHQIFNPYLCCYITHMSRLKRSGEIFIILWIFSRKKCVCVVVDYEDTRISNLIIDDFAKSKKFA